MHNMTIFHKATSGFNPRGASVQVFVFHALFFLGLGLSKIDFNLTIHTLVTNNYMENDKFAEIKILRYYIIRGTGSTIYEWG